MSEANERGRVPEGMRFPRRNAIGQTYWQWARERFETPCQVCGAGAGGHIGLLDPEWNTWVAECKAPREAARVDQP